MCSNDYKKETAQEWAQNPLSERFLYFVNYLRPSNNSRASFMVFSNSNCYSYELLPDLLWRMRQCDLSEAHTYIQWRKLNMSKGQELEDLSASQHLPQKERNQRTTLNVIKAE